MRHSTIDELIACWKREELTVAQMIGQILQVLRAQEQRPRERAWQPVGRGAAGAGGAT